MTENCSVCGKTSGTAGQADPGNITSGICDACVEQIAGSPVLLDAIDAPVLLMQGNPRQVVTANGKALALFGKELYEVENLRGGQVFDCVHSFTEAGCGKDVNCENCKIKDAIVDTFVTASSHSGVSSALSIKKHHAIRNYVLQVSTQKVGDLALVRIDRYEAGDGA